MTPVASASSNTQTIRISSVEGHSIWAETYDSEPNPLLALEFRIVSPKLRILRGRSFLDVACGTGRWLAEAQAQGARAFGVDLCREMLLRAEMKPGLKGRLAFADSRRLPFADCCADFVICAFALGYMDDPGWMMRELTRTVRPGGVLLISDFHPEGHDRGWKRSFRNGGRSYEIENFPHTTGELIKEGQAAGLRLKALLEPRFGGPEREIFQNAGRDALFEEARKIPAVLIMEWERQAGTSE